MRVEKLNYRSGGFHPVHLDDKFNHSRYTIIHKLGHGGFATVWLARDSVRERYVALKILAARLSGESPEVRILRRLRGWDGSGKTVTESGNKKSKETNEQGEHNMQVVKGKEYVMSMLDHFWINGPNGRHLCVVSEVGGPSIKQFNECPGLRLGTRRLRGEVARRVSLQATQGLAFIHSTGIVHGDFTAANILIQLAKIDEWTVEEIHERLGAPQTQDLHRMASAASNKSGPKYTVNAINMKLVDPKWLSDRIMIIDFGIAFLVEESSDHIGTPRNYCAPEFNFKLPRSIHSDIWALGCTLFEIRTGCCLFRYEGSPTRDQLLIELVKILGSLPKIWWDAWEKGSHWHELETMAGGQLISIPNGTLHSLIMDIGIHDGDDKPRNIGYQDMGFEKDNIASDPEKTPSSASEKRNSTTNRLVKMVEDLTTSEAAEVMALIGNKHDSGSSGSRASDSGNKSGSSNTKSGEKSSGSKSGDKSMSSEGISTKDETVSHGNISDGQPNPEKEASATTVDLLEPFGTVITEEEADCLENLLRSALTFLPEERATASRLVEHHWFTETYSAVIHK